MVEAQHMALRGESPRRHARRPWFEHAVEAKQKGDIHGRMDHASLVLTLRQGAECLRRVGQAKQAQAWEEEAARLDP
jgi:hypothetical protein